MQTRYCSNIYTTPTIYVSLIGTQQPVYENPSPVYENTRQKQSPPLPLTVSKTWLPGMCLCMSVFYYNLSVIKMTFLNKKCSIQRLFVYETVIQEVSIVDSLTAIYMIYYNMIAVKICSGL